MKKRKVTGELELFKEIWNERPQVSEISGTRLTQFNPSFFAHILSKGAYPKFRLKKENIVLMTYAEHYKFDSQTHKAKEDPLFQWVFKKKEELISEYYRK